MKQVPRSVEIPSEIKRSTGKESIVIHINEENVCYHIVSIVHNLKTFGSLLLRVLTYPKCVVYCVNSKVFKCRDK